MKCLTCGWMVALWLASSMPVGAQNAESSAAVSAGGIPLSELIAAVARKTGKRFIVDPRVQAELSPATTDLTRVNYDDFLQVLQVYGYAAIERGNVVLLVPDAVARAFASPLVAGNEKHPDAEIVTRVIHIRSVPAPQLVPILRPLVPQYGHLAASVCTNDLILVDRYANTKRIELIIQTLDKGEAYKPERCAPALPLPPPPPPRDGAARPDRESSNR